MTACILRWAVEDLRKLTSMRPPRHAIRLPDLTRRLRVPGRQLRAHHTLGRVLTQEVHQADSLRPFHNRVERVRLAGSGVLVGPSHHSDNVLAKHLELSTC